ncbi:hypothetical protein B0J14DRAFT_565652 [Halenospora varia]|nr:hypothetical protein B0J14DRAFT_565652 [Halenospora varia]
MSRNECRIVSLDFGPIDGGVQESELSSVELAETLSSQMKSNQGRRLLIVEDLTKDVVELLGSYLDINPLFFASHIDGPYVEMSLSRPSTATLPSKTKTQNFLSLHYQHAIEFESQPLAPRKLFCDGNVARKVVILPPTKNMHIGLVQHGCSIWKGATKKNSWLGGYEDFLERPRFDENDFSCPDKRSLLGDLLYFWRKALPPGFDQNDPTVLDLAYYPLKIAAGEWMNYTAVMSNSIKQYEYSTEASFLKEGLEKLESDLRSLEVWGRRCIQTTHKLHTVIRFINQRKGDTSNQKVYSTITEDYQYIAEMVEIYGRRLENMIPVLTSVIQISDTQRSLREAANVTRLTNLALLFVPLSFVTGLFSMNDGVSRMGLTHFFDVAIPMCVLVFIATWLRMSRWTL